MLIHFKRIAFISILFISFIGNCQDKDSIKYLVKTDSLLAERIQELEMKYKILMSDFMLINQNKDQKIDSLSKKQAFLLTEIDSMQTQLDTFEDSLEVSKINTDLLVQDFSYLRRKHKVSLIFVFSTLLGLIILSSAYIIYIFLREKKVNELKYNSLRKYTYNQLEEAKVALGDQIKQRLKKFSRKNKKQVSILQESLSSQLDEHLKIGKKKKAKKGRKKK